MRTPRLPLLAVSALLLLVPVPLLRPQAAAPAPATAADANRKALNDLFNDYWEDSLKHSPEFASELGDKRYNDQISDYSVKAYNDGLAREEGFMMRLAGVVGVLFILNLLIGLYNDPTEWPWTYVGIICTHGMFAVAQAGRSFGIDNLLAKGLIPGLRHDGPVARAIALAS